MRTPSSVMKCNFFLDLVEPDFVLWWVHVGMAVIVYVYMPVLNALDTPLEKSEEPLEREVIDAELQRLLETKPAQMVVPARSFTKWIFGFLSVL